MKYALAIFLSFPALSNTFQLMETRARFFLEITPEKLTYRSETMSRSSAIKKCNLDLANELNGKLFGVPSRSIATEGHVFKVDEESFSIDGRSEVAKLLFSMDFRILNFILESEKACK